MRKVLVTMQLSIDRFEYASGQVVDSSGAVVATFIIGAQSVPEPATLVLLGTGLCFLAFSARKRIRMAVFSIVR
jgi:hypothetical protein